MDIERICKICITGFIDYYIKHVTFLYLKKKKNDHACPWSLEASEASWKVFCGLMIPIWQNWSPHAKHLGRWHPATRLIAGQISGLSLMCRQGLQWCSALTLNLVLKGHQIIYNLYRLPLVNSGSCNNNDRWAQSTEQQTNSWEQRSKRNVVKKWYVTMLNTGMI